MSAIEWSQLYKHRNAIAKRYPQIWDLPLAKRYFNVLFTTTLTPGNLLEIGAGDRDLKKKVEQKWPSCQYASFDIDHSQFHDFYKLEDIRGEYDIICMFEIIEHITPDLALQILKKAS